MFFRRENLQIADEFVQGSWVFREKRLWKRPQYVHEPQFDGSMCTSNRVPRFRRDGARQHLAESISAHGVVTSRCMPARYLLPIALLTATLVAFLLAGRGGYTGFGWWQRGLRVLVAIPLLISGIFLHFLHAEMVASIIPPIFPARYFLAVFTGVCEVAGAIGLFVPWTRRAAALWLALMMIAVFPANIYVAGQTIGHLHMPSVLVRTAMQWVYLVSILLAGYGLPVGRRGAQGR